MGVASAITVLVQLSLLCFPAFGDMIIQTMPPTKSHHYMVPAPAPSHHHHHHHHRSSHPHVQPPSHAPVYPPTPSPSPSSPLPHPPMTHSHPPIHPPKPSAPHPPVHSPKPSPPPPPMGYPHPPVHAPTPPVHPPHPHPFPRSFVAVRGVVYCKSCKYAGSDTLLGAKPILGAKIKLECNNTKYPLAAKATTDKNGYFFLEAPKKVTSYGAHKCKVSLVASPLASCSKPTDLRGGVTGGSLRPRKPYVVNKSPFVLFDVGPFAFAPNCSV